ncbi:MAG: PD-(D/E)XK nuclease family protein [Gemmatimonadetes bacterium]|nr:PD-(D/E)XK nuclease family protein [Gemmatimonadota bacterium]
MFLGWDHPALPAAAAHLIEHYIEGSVADLRRATIVLPGRRARRRVIELLLDEAEVRGATLIPPEATTVGGLPELLHTSPKPFADEVTSRRAWSRALRDVDREAVERVFPHLPESESPTEWDELAGLLAGLHETLAREGRPFGDVVKMCRSGLLFDDGARWQGLAQVQREYLQLLERSGLADRFETRRLALESELPPFIGDIWLVSIVELPDVTRRLLEASGATVRALIHSPAELSDGIDAATVFDNFGLPSADYWERATVPVTDQILTVVERPVDQAEAVMDGLAGLGGAYSAEEIVVAVHRESEVVPYLGQRLEARNVTARYAAGTPLSRTGPVRLLQAVADYVSDPTFQALAALLRHPDAGPLTGPTAAVAAGIEAIEVADKYFMDHLPFRVRGEIPRGQRGAALFPPVLRAIEREGPLRAFGGRKPLSEWMPVVMDVLLKAYGESELDRSRPAHRRQLDALMGIQVVAASLAAIPEGLDETCSGAEAIRMLLVELREEALPPDPGRNAVELLDWLELPLDDAPVVMITAFNEGFLPESVSGHAFLPDALRTRLGLPDNRSRLARDAYRLTTVLHSKESVRIITGRRTSQGDPLRPSRLMFRIPEEQMPARVLRFLERARGGDRGSSLASLGLEPGAQSRFTVPPEELIELGEDEVPTGLAVTGFRALLKDPYRFVLEKVYGLRRLDDTARELDPMGFGNLAHEILHRFGLLALESPPKVDVSSESEVARSLMDLLDDDLSTRFGEDAMPAVQLQAEQLKMRFRAFAERQAQWAAQGWRIVAVECKGHDVPFDVDGTPFFLRGRIDRIDHNPATGEWAVLDYKTGAFVDPPEKAHRKSRGRDHQWIDLQLPLYRRLLSGIFDGEGLRVIDIDVDDTEQSRIHFGFVSLPQEVEETAFMIADWTEEDFASAETAAREAVRHLREGSFKFDPNVTRVTQPGQDPLEPLLAVGWQAVSELEEPKS